jgi:hypothetical protein
VIAPNRVVIGCDHAQCCIAFKSNTDDVRVARREARRAGWGVRLRTHHVSDGFSKLVDYCPAHVADHLKDSVDAGPL